MINSYDIERFLGEHKKVIDAVSEGKIVFFITAPMARYEHARHDDITIEVFSSNCFDRGHVYYDLVDKEFNFTYNGEIKQTIDHLFLNAKDVFTKYLELLDTGGYMPNNMDDQFVWDICRDDFLKFIRPKIEQIPDNAYDRLGQETMEKLLKEIYDFIWNLKAKKLNNLLLKEYEAGRETEDQEDTR